MDPTSRAQGLPPQREGHVGHAHFWQRALSRGQFIGTAAGAAGVALSSGLWMPTLAQADQDDEGGVLARPIPGGNRFLAPPLWPTLLSSEVFHVFNVGPANELSAITDFTGVIGAAHLQGPVQRTLADGSATTLYCDYDLRFMQGRYIGVDGQLHRGTFSFFWFDLYQKLDASGAIDFTSTQFTSIDPGNVPNGLFWTVLVPDESVHVDLRAGSAVMQVSNLATLDFVTFENDALHGTETPPIPTTVSFTVQWSGLQEREPVSLPILADNSPGFSADLAQSTSSGVTVVWAADEPTAVVNGVTGAHYAADATTPAATVLYAALGHERNGVFRSRGHHGGDTPG